MSAPIPISPFVLARATIGIKAMQFHKADANSAVHYRSGCSAQLRWDLNLSQSEH
jgi:hypothetical protein